MKKKINITFIIFFSAFMLSVSVMSFQYRYDRRKEDSEKDPNVIELADLYVLKMLKSTWFFELPPEVLRGNSRTLFYYDTYGFGNQHTVTFHPHSSCQLKFVLIDYIGVFDNRRIPRTYYPLHLFS